MILTLGLLTEASLKLGGTIEYSQNHREMSANTHPLKEVTVAAIKTPRKAEVILNTPPPSLFYLTSPPRPHIPPSEQQNSFL